MAFSITATPRTRADWTPFGACTSGSTAPPRGATRRACGGAGTTSTQTAEDDHGPDARTVVDRERGILPRHVGRDDGSDDAAITRSHAVALSRSRRQVTGSAPGSVHGDRGR